MRIPVHGLDPYSTENKEAERGVHDIDERLSVTSIEFGLELVTGMIRRMQ
jgi:hypothetical protein